MNKNKVFILLLLISGLVLLSYNKCYSQLLEKKVFRLKQKQETVNFDFKYQINTKPLSIQKTEKNMVLAGVLSLIVPGAALGQVYKEEFINAGIRIGISIGCIIWFMLSPTFDYGGGGDATQKLIATGIYAVNWLASVVDAIIPAKNISKKYRHNYHSF